MYKLILTTMTCALLAMPWAPTALAGNGGYSTLVRQLLYARDDDDREDAAEDLAKYGTPTDIIYLQWSAAHDPEKDVRKDAAKAIRKIQSRYRRHASPPPPSPAPVYTVPTTTYVSPTTTYVSPTTTYVSPTTTYVSPTTTYYPPTTYVAPTVTYYVAPTYVAPRVVTVVRSRPAVTYRTRRRTRTYTHACCTKPRHTYRPRTYRPTTIRYHGTRSGGSRGYVGVSIGSYGGGARLTYSGKSFSIGGRARW